MIESLAKEYGINLDTNTIILYMEWAGKGIQKNVAVSELDKAAFIFSEAKVRPFNEEEPSFWIPTKIK